MANGQVDLQRTSTILALYRKANDLGHEAQMLNAAGPHSPDPALFQQKAAAATQEAFFCSAKAHALQAGNAYSYPGPQVIQQVTNDCQTLEQAIAASAGWATIIAAGDAVIASMPANSI